MNKDTLKTVIDAVHKYTKESNEDIVVIDYTEPSVVHSFIGEYCMVHIVSLPKTPDKLFVLCHYGSSPKKAGTELGSCLMDYLGFMPEMPDYIRGKVTNGNKIIPVLGFFVDKENNEETSQMRALCN